MPYDPRGMAFSIESQQQQQLANAMLGHGEFDLISFYRFEFNP